MDVTVTGLSPDSLNALRSLAKDNGKTLEEYARSLLEEASAKSLPPRKTIEERIKAIEELGSDLDPNLPVLSDEQISRDSIYEEQIKRQL